MQLNAKKVKTLKQIPNSSEEYHDISTLASQKSIKRNTNVILQNNEMSSRKVSERKSKKFEVNKSNYPKFFYRSPQNVHESKTFMNQNNVF